jgi:hypothetical protein
MEVQHGAPQRCEKREGTLECLHKAGSLVHWFAIPSKAICNSQYQYHQYQHRICAMDELITFQRPESDRVEAFSMTREQLLWS